MLPFGSQGLGVLRTIYDLGRQVPVAVDTVGRSVKEKYTRLSERASAVGRGAAGVAGAFEMMRGGDPLPRQADH